MSNLTRPLAAGLCIGAGLAPFLLFFYMLLQEKAIRHRMEEKLEENRLTEIVIANTDWHWVKAGKEIRVNGRLFDIHSYTAGEIQSRFRGLFDEEETALQKILELATEKNAAGRQQWLARLFQNLQNLYPSVFTEQSHIPVYPSRLLPANVTSLLKGFRLIFSPPPRPCGLSFC